LPSVKFHCGILAVGALRRAIRTYLADRERPAWLPEELTPDEKHAVEEEKLMEILTKRAARYEAVKKKEEEERKE
ncbi:MAG: hypothetical protein GKC05_07740, partial [Methanomicrobiales archaeon]|nr:hypothetical protein [Methanomicrobiales archaeon]